jgi:transcription-repair coupling factor (superfamily II helicase)
LDYKLKLHHLRESSVLTRIPKDSQGFLASEISKNFPNSDRVFIAQNDAEMDLIQKQLRFFSPEIEVLNFFAWDCLPYDRASPKPTILASRIKTLYRLATRRENENFFIITSINSLFQKTVAPSQIKNLGLFLQVGTKISLIQISEFLIAKGYSREACANNVGEFAVRGGIVDIVMQQAADLIGYRVDFFGDEIESIKVFDPLTQITQESVKSLQILPASEVIISKKTVENFRQKYRENFGASLDDQLYAAISESRSYAGMEHWLPFFYEENLVGFFEYLKNPTIFFDSEIFDLAKKRQELIDEYYQARVVERKIQEGVIYNPIEPQLLYFSAAEITEILKKNITIRFEKFETSEKNKRILDLEIKPVPDFALAGRTNQKDPIELMKSFILGEPTLKKGEETRSGLGGFNSDAKLSTQTNHPNQLHSQLSHPLFQRGLIVACLTESFKDRLEKLFFDYGIPCQEIKNFTELKNVKAGKAALSVLQTDFGFYTSDFILIGEQAIFGEKVVRKKSSKAASQRLIEEGLAIAQNELVVHRDHGIGKFDGIHTITVGDGNNESPSSRLRVDSIPLNKGIMSAQKSQPLRVDMLKILYGGNDTLFVPVDDINLITRYGAENPLIQLDRLGVAAWKNRKEKVRKRIKVAAEELLKIAAARHLKKAPSFVANQHFYDEFCARFGFVETEDQANAISEVEEDLRRGSPMDRLICGDVGFGKTEVAMRAVAIVVGEDVNAKAHQIAIIAPTTLLVRQHYKNFVKRFDGTGIKIAQLSRLVSTSDAKKTREQIESGEVQIVIGTHALLQKTIKFKNLSLVIIDEEQHFGVAQKERLKELRNEVHVLTLSATPIPRTLQMSLTGVKDLSLIATPPLDRLAVRNFVMPYDSVITREAIIREYNRGGRIFFVVPRIRDIEEMEPRLKILLPEIKITHAHGQMSPTQLDQIMNDFTDGKIDMLLSTTIIESGIDISQANTMIIYKAEMFGLSQLYQLRGRVGRGKARGYCYFMLDNRKKISDESKKKLEVMQNLDSLGVGFSVASHDMDIRGSGNLLGDEQSGHVKETGVELYQQMLLETIEDLKGKVISHQSTVDSHGLANDNLGNSRLTTDDLRLNSDFHVQIKLGISLLIPEKYMQDLSLRMSFYKKIAAIKTADEQENLIAEMTDRFGKVPAEILNLTEIAKLKWSCKKVGVEKLEAVSEGILISFRDNKFAAPDELLKMVFTSKNQIKISSGQKVLFVCDVKSEALKILAANQAIQKLAIIAQKNDGKKI